jgi:hypothetical protein
LREALTTMQTPEQDPITFDGKRYASIDDMPPAVRRAYEDVAEMMADRNADGMPDMLEDGDPAHVEATRRAHAELTRQGKARRDQFTPVADATAARRDAECNRPKSRRPIPWFVWLFLLLWVLGFGYVVFTGGL